MFAVAQGKTITISKDAIKAMCQSIRGYKVQMHALPDYVFLVEAESGDEAIAYIVNTCNKNGKAIKSNAATFSRI